MFAFQPRISWLANNLDKHSIIERFQTITYTLYVHAGIYKYSNYTFRFSGLCAKLCGT